jgi:putative inorganic carbon (hco3(-)) transporter
VPAAGCRSVLPSMLTRASVVRGSAWYLTAALIVGAFALAVKTYDAVPVLAFACLLLALGYCLVRPEIATLAAVFLLYMNIPALAAKSGAPTFVTTSFAVLFGFALLKVLVRRERLRFDSIFWLMIAYLAVLLLSSVGARDPAAASRYVTGYVLEGIVLYWLVVNAVRKSQTLHRVLWTTVIAGALLGGMTAYQETTGAFHHQFAGLAQRNAEYIELRGREVTAETRELLESAAKRGKSRRPGGPVEQPNRFAQIMVVLIPLAILGYRSGRSPVVRFLAAASGTLILIGVMLTFSRGSFVALVLLTGTMVAIRWLAPRPVLLGGMLMVACAAVIAPSYFDRLDSITSAASLFDADPTRHHDADGAIRGRTTQMLAAMLLFVDNPVIGAGPGQFSRYVVEYSDNPAIRFRAIQQQRRAHNLYVEIAAETGIVGLSVFLLIVGVIMRRLWLVRSYWTPCDAHRADVLTALFLSLLAYLLTGMFAHLSYQRYYWLLIAMSSAAVHIYAPQQREHSVSHPDCTY